MKSTGLLKIILGILLVIPAWFIPWPIEPEGLLTSPYIPFIVLVILIPLWKRNSISKGNIRWPNWNDGLLSPKSELGNLDFFGIFITLQGIVMIFISLKNHSVSSGIGESGVSFGLGILAGMLITVQLSKRASHSEK